MATEVVMPRQGNTVESCLIVAWKVSVGDSVSPGDALCEVETDKSTIEVESEHSGTVLALLYDEGDDVPVQVPMLIVGEPGEDVSSLVATSSAAAEPAQSNGGSGESPDSVGPPPAHTQPAEQPAVQQAAASGAASAEGGSTGFASPRARVQAQANAVSLEGISGSGPQGRIIERDVLAAAASQPVVSPSARSAGALSGQSGSGIGGRLRLGEQPAASGSPAISPQQQSAQAIASAGSSRSAEAPSPGEVQTITPSGIRKVIASRMMQSLQSSAQFTLNASADARSMQAWRKKLKTSPERLGLNGITLGDMTVFAASRVLLRYPELNATYENGQITRYGDVHLGLAVDTPRGLMVPVIRNADRKSLKQISDESKALAAACQQGNISPDNLSGATFTLSNLGSFGVESFTPVINSPQVAILGVCTIVQRPLPGSDGSTFVPHMGFSMTIDHQVVDGAPAARFLQEYCALLADFELAAAL